MRISTKLAFGFGALTTILAVGAGLSLWGANDNRRRTREVEERFLPEAAVAQQVAQAVHQVHFAILAGAEMGSADGLRKVESAHAAATQGWEAARKGIAPGSGLATRLGGLAAAYAPLYDKGRTAVKLSVDQDIVAQAEAMKEYRQLFKGFEGDLAQFEAAASRALKDALESIAVRSARLATLNLAFAAIGIAIGLIVAVSLIGGIRDSLGQAVRFSDRLAGGDLTAELAIRTKDELGAMAQTLNTTTANLRAMLQKVRLVFTGLENASHHIADVSHGIAEGTSGQSHAVATVSSSIEEMNASIKSVVQSVENLFALAGESSSSMLEMSASVEQVAGNADGLSAAVERSSSAITEMTTSVRSVAEHAARLAELMTSTSAAISAIDSVVREVERSAGQSNELSREVAQTMGTEGLDMLRRTADGMSEIREAVGQSTAVIHTLENRSREIGGILDVINEVNDQTNLLALNAAILAAQAGEHGLGFAVVAEEIRALSARTAASTKEITHLIEGVMSESRKAVAAAEAGARKVEEGVATVEALGVALRRAAENSEKASAASHGIARAMTEQYHGIRQIAASAQSINEMSHGIAQATREQAAGSAQIAKAAEELLDLARQVKKAMSEQAQGVRLTTRASENSALLAQKVLDATRDEAKGSDLVVKSIGAIQEVTGTNAAAVKHLDEMVNGLSQQAALLKLELARFKVD